MPRQKKITPPFESPLEEEFYLHITPFLKKNVKLIPQYEIETICNNFRLDFYLEYKKLRIGIELDGATTHDQKAQIYDFWRDSVILSEKHVDRIYRISGERLIYNLDAVILKLFDFISQLFDLDIKKPSQFEAEIDQEVEVIVGSPKDKNRQKIYKYIQTKNGGRLNPLIYKYKKQYGHFGLGQKKGDL